MSVRWKDKTNITVDGVDRMPITDASDDNTDKYITAEQLALYTLNGTTRAEVSLLDAGSNEAIYDSGTGLRFRAGGQSVFNVNTTGIIPSGAGYDIGASGSKFEDLYIDGTAYLDAIDLNGTAITATGAELNHVSGVESQLAGLAENHAQSYVTATAATIELAGQEGIVNFNTTTNAIRATLPVITIGKSEEYLLLFGTDGMNDVTIDDGAGDGGFVKADGTTVGTSIIFDDAKDFVFLKSSSMVDGKWMILGGFGYTLT